MTKRPTRKQKGEIGGRKNPYIADGFVGELLDSGEMRGERVKMKISTGHGTTLFDILLTILFPVIFFGFIFLGIYLIFKFVIS